MFYRNLFRVHTALWILSAIFIVLIAQSSAMAQQLPPRPLSVFVNPAQPLSFGAFYQGPLGGTVIVYPNGSRSVTGDVVQANLGFSFSPALFEVEALPGTLVTLLDGPDVILTGSNGGSMALHLGSSAPGSPFVVPTTPPSRTVVTIGGTLHVSTTQNNPPGSYIGTFNVTFIEQ